jgi:hypothetical protein
MSDVDKIEYERLKILDEIRQVLVKSKISIMDYLIHTDYQDIESGGESLINLHDRLAYFLYGEDVS